LFSFVFGAEWSKAGDYASILVPYFIFYLPASVLSYVPTAFRVMRTGLYVALVGNAISLLIYFIAGTLYDLETAFILITTIMSSYYLIIIIWYLNLIKTKSTNLPSQYGEFS
jgi:O-antigen/teichoic acid export membrane protein